MDYRIVRRFYSNVEANIYYLRLTEGGINCFLSQENISTILPLSDGGVVLNVVLEQVDESLLLMKDIESDIETNKVSQDFREATKEDIYYEKEVVEYEKKLDGGWIDNNIVSVVIFMLFFIVVLVIVVNFFFPFIT